MSVDPALLAAHFGRMQAGEQRSGEALLELQRSPGCVTALLSLIHSSASLPADAAEPPLTVFSTQALQKCLRRAPAVELSSAAPTLAAALHGFAARHWGASVTQLCLGLVIVILRSEAPPEQSLRELLESFEAESGGAERSACVAFLTLLAEELHEPAARVSVAPQRVQHVRQARERERDRERERERERRRRRKAAQHVR